METDRSERARSIRAARDWLTGAENALAGEDDLAGDLKLMLARAELARISADRRARLRRWAALILPPLAAAAVWAWMTWTPPQEERSVHPPYAAADTQADAPASETSAQVEVPPVPAMPSEALKASADEAPQATVAADPDPVRTQSEPERNAAVPQMPNPDMQRLMQVGGKILRE